VIEARRWDSNNAASWWQMKSIRRAAEELRVGRGSKMGWRGHRCHETKAKVDLPLPVHRAPQAALNIEVTTKAGQLLTITLRRCQDRMVKVRYSIP
jgi:hypothetical protein